MALSTCPKCGNHHFELRAVEPSGSAVKMYCVQCSSCGVPVGVTDFYPHSTVIARIDALEKKLQSIEGEIATVGYNVQAIAQRTR